MQRKAVWTWVRGLGGKLAEGINLTKVSLPVEIFEPRSFLQRLSDSWIYLDLLIAAAECADPVERLRLLVAFAISGLVQQVPPCKPFNPILGETVRAKYRNGVEVFGEQVSHHPPVSSWQALDPQGRFEYHGDANWTATTRANSVRAHQQGVNWVRFTSDGAEVTWNLPIVNLRNVLFGERSLKYSGNMVFEDKQNGLSIDVEVDPEFEKGFLAKSSLFSSLFASGSQGPGPDIIRGELLQHGQPIDAVSGSWLSHVHFRAPGRSYWTRDVGEIHFPEPAAAPLASDSRFRKDLVALKAGDLKRAQEGKQELEEKQRRDAKLRKKGKAAMLDGR